MSIRPHLTLALAAVLLAIPLLNAQQLKPIQLPSPQTTGGVPLMQALAQRHTTRVFRDQPLSPQTLSNLLWAAFGINRSASARPGPGRTAPSAMNKQEIQLDVLLPTGVYAYDAEHNLLRQLVAEDVRSSVLSEAGARAPVTILYVAGSKDSFAQVDTGFIGQNVYLFAASEGLNAWFYTIKPQAVTTALQLPNTSTPLYAQSVGYPPASK
ncbi:MAG TPA: nitroreductase family protein [Acidobacteriaceae bacterium]